MKRTAMRLLRVLIPAVLLFGGICLVFALLQRSLIYFPTPPRESSIPFIELQRPDAVVRVSLLKREGPRAVIYFGGNAEEVSLGLGEIAEAFPDSAVYAMHYRGYSGSTGKPSEENLLADARALFDLVAESHDQIFLAGRSLGSGLAVHLASEREVAGLLLITPFDSLVNVAKHYYPWLPVNLLLLDRYESWKYASKVTAPTLIVAAEQDSIIPKRCTVNLEKSFPEGICQSITIKDADHNFISLPIEAIDDFLIRQP
jgi:uncharacterized protein